MTSYRFGLVATVTALILGGSLLPAQAQEPGVTLQRELTEARVRRGDGGEDIVRGPQSDLPLDRYISEVDQRFIYPGSADQTQSSRTLVASPTSDTQINEVESSTSTLRQITSGQEANSDR